jgi:adenylate cyclase
VTAQRGETAGGRICVVSTKATGDNVAYRDYADRHRAIAKSLGFEGHMAHAEAMR